MSLISDININNENTLKIVFDKYHQAVFRYVFDKTKSEFLAREVVQISFIKLWKYRNKLEVGSDISTLLFTIVRTTMIDEIRKNKVMRKHYENYRRTIGANDMVEISYCDETMKRLESLISTMPPVRQLVFRLSRIDNCSHREISERLSIAPKTVENHINLALKYLKSFLPL